MLPARPQSASVSPSDSSSSGRDDASAAGAAAATLAAAEAIIASSARAASASRVALAANGSLRSSAAVGRATGSLSSAAATHSRKCAEAAVAAARPGGGLDAILTMTWKTDVVDECGGLRSASSMAVMPSDQMSTCPEGVNHCEEGVHHFEEGVRPSDQMPTFASYAPPCSSVTDANV